MPEQEILDKLEGLIVFDNLRLGKLVGEGKEKVVLHATKLDDNKELVLKLYQSNPMFLLNEVDFDFLPRSTVEAEAQERYLNILEKLLTACERENPGLFFWHMESLYTRILIGFCESFEEYNMPVLDTTTSCFQNGELIVVGQRALNRKTHSTSMVELEYWEYRLKEPTLRSVVDFLSQGLFQEPLSFSDPTVLLAVVFCEGFFRTIPSKEDGAASSGGLLGDLTDDHPAPVEAEKILSQFLASTDFKSTVPSMNDGVSILKKALEQLRGMLLEDAFDKAEQLRGLGEQFVMKYNAGRNNLLRGLPRCIRVMLEHLR